MFLALLSAFVYYYNYFIVEYYKTQLERTQIETELQRRNDLIPNLVKAVNDYMAFENKIFQHAADVRSALSSLKSIPEASPSQLSLAERSFQISGRGRELSRPESLGDLSEPHEGTVRYGDEDSQCDEYDITGGQFLQFPVTDVSGNRLRVRDGFQARKRLLNPRESAKKVPDVR